MDVWRAALSVVFCIWFAAWIYGYSVVFCIWIAAWIYGYVTQGVCKSKARLDGKTVIITGCDSGIGKATAFDLARRGARVIMACIRVAEAHAVREQIVTQTNNRNVVVKIVDVSSLRSVRKFAEDTNRTEDRLDVLIHNAGVLIPARPITEEGLNTTLATNHFGPFLLTHLLIDLLKRTAKSRIVVVASSRHDLGGVDPENPNPSKHKNTSKISFNWKMYCDSKFACVLTAKEMSYRLAGSGVTVNVLHPGNVFSGILGSFNPVHFDKLLFIFPFYKTLTQAAQTTIHLAVSEEVEKVSGKYFIDCEIVSPAKGTEDVELAKRYWRACEEIVQLKPSDPHI